jgi:hypothetical protein
MDRWRPGRTKQFGRAAIGDARPNPLLRSDLVMDNAADAKKADKTGVYVVTDDTGIETHAFYKEGAILPANATYRGERDEVTSPRQAERERIAGNTVQEQAETVEDVAEERAKGPAPENRARAAAPEKK